MPAAATPRPAATPPRSKSPSPLGMVLVPPSPAAAAGWKSSAPSTPSGSFAVDIPPPPLPLPAGSPPPPAPVAWCAVVRHSSGDLLRRSSPCVALGDDGRTDSPQIGLRGSVSSPLHSPRAVQPASGSHTPPPAPAADDDERKLARRAKVAAELLATEQTYVRQLSKIIFVFAKPLKAVLEQEELDGLFANLPAIRSLHQALIGDLTERIQSWDDDTTVGDLFQEASRSFKLYKPYINNYEKALALHLSLLDKNPKYKQFVNDINYTEQLDGLSVDGFLILPVQRIPRYVLLIQELIKSTPESHADRPLLADAVEQLMGIADYINEMKRESEKKSKLQEVRSHWRDYEGNLNDNPERVFIRQIVAAGGPRGKQRLWLFSDILVITTHEHNDDGVFQYQVDLAACQVHSSATSPGTFVLQSPEVNLSGTADPEALASLDSQIARAKEARGQSCVSSSTNEGSDSDFRRKSFKALLSLAESEREFVLVLQKASKVAFVANQCGAVPAMLAGSFTEICQFLDQACVDHHKLHCALEARENAWSSSGTISDIFVEALPRLKAYAEFASLLNDFRQYLKDKISEESDGPLTALLVLLEKVPPRVREYCVVLGNVVKTAGNVPEAQDLSRVTLELESLVTSIFLLPLQQQQQQQQQQ
eukprot:m51a1_g1580 putative domain containing protein (651) ;mRNA; r:111795-113951